MAPVLSSVLFLCTLRAARGECVKVFASQQAGMTHVTTQEMQADLGVSCLAATKKQGRGAGQKPLMMVHIHKNAGTFMCKLAHAVGEHVVQPNKNCNWDPHDDFSYRALESKMAVSCEKRAEFFRSHGYTYGQVEHELWPSSLCFGDFDYAVMLREPVAHMHSHVNFSYKGPSVRSLMADFKARIAASSPDKMAHREDWVMLDNYQTRVLANAFEVPAGRIDQTHLETARQVLKKFAVVGRVEDLKDQDRLRGLLGHLGWGDFVSCSEVFDPTNVNHAPRYEFDEEEKAWLRERNQIDHELFMTAL